MKKLILAFITLLSLSFSSKSQIVDSVKYLDLYSTDTLLIITTQVPQIFTYYTITTKTVRIPKSNTTPVNQPPIVDAGQAQTITLPVNTVTLSGIASDPDGTIVSYSWTQISGSVTNIVSLNSSSTIVSFTSQGQYLYQLTVVDNKGASTSSKVGVTVNPQPSTGLILIYENDISIGTGGASKLGDLDPFNHGQIGSGYFDTKIYVSAPGAFHSRPLNVSSGIRSEIQFDAAQTPLEGRVEFDVYFIVFISSNGHWLQFHPSTLGGSGSPRIEGTQVVNWNKGDNTYYSTSFKPVLLHWYHCIVDYKFGSSGYIHWSMDGVSVFSKDNIQVGDGSTPYLKIGFNGWTPGNPTSSDIVYDNIKIYKK